MKKWMTPSVEELDMTCTEYGTRYAKSFDEVRVDQNGQYWYSYSAGATSPVTPSASVIKVDQP
ncbi:MAG: hypothetical protein IIT46_12525 [Lachnospiraceae bacterium]|nr:hypothetical protein [Lachnospiraceae bacterium]